jgi:hypothetical protein
MTDIVSGTVSTVTDLGKDESFLKGWLEEQPSRLGLGELEVGESATDDAFVLTDDERCFSVDVQLGEMEASRGFQVLDNWARNRALHPDRTHVAVLVTEVMSDRYQTTFETLSEHLPLVVVELQVWKGQDEAIVIPHVALASADVDLAETPAAKAAEAVAKVTDKADETEPEQTTDESEPVADENETVADETESTAEVVSEAEAVAAEAEAMADAEAAAEDAAEGDDTTPENKDDTGVGNPWGLEGSGAGSTGLLSKVGQ